MMAGCIGCGAAGLVLGGKGYRFVMTSLTAAAGQRDMTCLPIQSPSTFSVENFSGSRSSSLQANAGFGKT
ncbi:hypothetical protein ACLB2K_024141 [Fragaria x ananassa]